MHFVLPDFGFFHVYPITSPFAYYVSVVFILLHIISVCGFYTFAATAVGTAQVLLRSSFPEML